MKIDVRFPDGVRQVTARAPVDLPDDEIPACCRSVSALEPVPMEGWLFVRVFAEPKFAARPVA